ncbi:MAG TPA: hypothetical protein PKY25_00795 [Bacilli bacterium]|nr:hypothetical protein [Bacilli bacterium]
MTIIDKKNMKLVADIEIKRKYYLPTNKDVYIYNNEYYIEKKDRITEYKEKGKLLYFAELFSEFLSPIFNLENAEYVYIKDGDKYTLASKSFIKSYYDYFILYDLRKVTPIYKKMYDGSLNGLESFSRFYSSEAEYNKLIESILNLFAFDFYTHQGDRSDFNIMFMNKKKTGFLKFSLAPIYDNEFSFSETYGKSEHISNYFYFGHIYQDNFQALLEKYPNGVKTFKSILDINMDEMLRQFLIESEHSNNYITDDGKDIIKRVDEESKQLVLKYIK